MGRRKNFNVFASIKPGEFRKDYLERRLSHRKLAAKYNCSKAYIPLIVEKLRILPRLNLRELLSKEKLWHMYVDQEMSENDIVEELQSEGIQIGKSWVANLLREHDITRRPLSSSREIALKKGKISITYTDRHGKQRKIQSHYRTVNHQFFKKWSPQMAYVLGVMATDGALESHRQFALSLSQNDSDFVKKIRSLIGSNAKLLYLPKRGRAGALCRMAIGSEEMVADLVRLGVTFKKSLTIRFPKVPLKYMRHFLRGCWDGDGSVYWSKKCGLTQSGSSITSGSWHFINGIRKNLIQLGLPPRPIDVQKKRNYVNEYYSVRWHGRDSAKLFHIFYDGVSKEMYLSRKYEKFKTIAKHFDDD